ncbi:MAG: response regulator [Planctomycetia bacterium]|nr:response regulator [Planctomycetia bacterium]
MIRTWPSILITDDDDALREALGTVFAPRGFKVHLASDGEWALRIIRSEPVDIVLLDMHMPRLTGLETIRQLKQFKADLPCILMSADADDALVRQAQQADAYAVLRKPVSGCQVSRTVCDALAQAYDWPPGFEQHFA